MPRSDHDAPKRVLVVDDEESIRTYATRLLSNAGYAVQTAADGPEALEVVTHTPPFDLFVLDVVMPQMNGDELARRLRQENPDAKALYFTGYPDKLLAFRKMLWENEAFIEKPVSLNGLLEAVALMLTDHTEGLPRKR
jgi:CheY-like chemotaxis protein